MLSINAVGRRDVVPDPDKYHDEPEAKTGKRNVAMISEMEAYDDVSGVKLDREKVNAARKEEIEWFREKGVHQDE